MKVDQFLKEVKTELTKITWPSYNELVGSMAVVFVLILFFALYLGLIDFIFGRLAEKLFTY